MATLSETIDGMTGAVATKRQSLDDALAGLQDWIDSNAARMTAEDRSAFSATLSAEKDVKTQDGQPFGDDGSLIGSVLRLHTMRLLYRFDERREGRPPLTNESPYGRAAYRLQIALRETEMAINEARVDAAIANAHHILADRSANRRWLQDALARMQTVVAKDLIKLAESIPAPDLPPLNFFQKAMFTVLGIKQEEIGRRNLKSLHQLAELQHNQLIEMVKLLADSFSAIGDRPGAQQAIALLARLQPPA